MLASGAVNSGGNFNHITSHVVRHAIDAGLQTDFIRHLRSAYRARLEAMDEALSSHLADLARWRRPEGGYFFWLELPAGVDTAGLKPLALEAGTGFQPGVLFSNCGELSNALRLSFAHYGVDDIHEGVTRLAAVLKNSRVRTSPRCS